MSGFEPRNVGAGCLSRRPGKASFLSILGWGIALRWDAGELRSTTPQAEHSPIGQRTKRRRSLVRKGRYRSSQAHCGGLWERPLFGVSPPLDAASTNDEVCPTPAVRHTRQERRSDCRRTFSFPGSVPCRTAATQARAARPWSLNPKRPAHRARSATMSGSLCHAAGRARSRAHPEKSATALVSPACGVASLEDGFSLRSAVRYLGLRRGPMLASGSTRAESAMTRIVSCIPTMDQIRKTIPDGLPTGV
jgi:hypothetical protein